MDFIEFWENEYSKDITTLSDEVIKIFSEPFSDEIYENYDVGEVLCEFVGHHGNAKKFDKIELFGEAVKLNHPKLYHSTGGYINNALIEYYCFTGDEEKVKNHFHDYASGDFDYDFLLENLRLIIHFRYAELANEIIIKIYENVKNNPKWLEGAEYDLDYYKYYLELEEFYNKNKEAIDQIDYAAFKDILTPYNFNLEEKHFKIIEIGLFNNSGKSIESLIKDSDLDDDAHKEAILFSFFKFMHTKNCPFATSQVIWRNLRSYFKEMYSNDQKDFFVIEYDSFKEYLEEYSGGFFCDSTLDHLIAIWGSRYANDFAFQQNWINEEAYIKYNLVIEDLKRDFRVRERSDIWKYGFVHQWLLFDNADLEKIEVDKNKFKSSFEVVVKPRHFGTPPILDESNFEYPMDTN